MDTWQLFQISSGSIPEMHLKIRCVADLEVGQARHYAV
jgi:hypothetical protein